MKQVSAIFLSLLLLYNMMGYTLIYWVEDNIPATNLSSTKEEFKYINIPVSMPYLNDWESPEPAEGRLTMDTDFYQIVEKQLINDTLRVKVKVDLAAKNRFEKLGNHVNDHYTTNQSEPAGKSTKLFKAFEKDYFKNYSKITVFLIEWRNESIQPFDNQVLSKSNLYDFILGPPPKFFI